MAAHPRTFLTALAIVFAAHLFPTARAQTQDSITIERRPVAPRVIADRPLRVIDPNRSTVQRVFQLSEVFGDQETFDITLSRPGVVRITADWRGSTQKLALLLNGPGQTGYYARRDGPSALRIEFNVTEELFHRGRNWRVSVVNFSRRGNSVGRIVVDYPSLSMPLARLSPTLRRIGEAASAEPPVPAGAPERSILPDGRVQVRYPDGRIVIYEAGCGYTTIYPDGTTSSALCNQVQPALLPALPSDPNLRSFLDTHCDHLLQQISQLVDHRQDQVDLYLSYESGNADGLFEQIQMRMRLIDKLLE